jgi:hypothetical protein
MKPSWNTLTVQQFVDLYRLSITQDIEEMTKLERAICIVYDKTEREIEEMKMGEFSELSKQVAVFLTQPIPGKPVRQIKVGGHRYSIIYNPANLQHRQYVEIITFGRKPIENMHLIMASIVQPVTWYGRKLPNLAINHQAIASDLLQAKVVDVYHACVFFCNLYGNLINNIRDYLVQQMMTKGLTKEESNQLVTYSIQSMVGFIPQNRLQILKT